MPKKKKNLSSKRPSDPLGKKQYLIILTHQIYKCFMVFLDDILRNNLQLAKNARSAEKQSRPLGIF